MTSPNVILGADWVNLSVIRDYSTDTRTFEIHLAIDLGDEANAQAIEKLIRDASVTGKASDLEAGELKRALKAQLKKNGKSNISTERMVDAILLKAYAASPTSADSRSPGDQSMAVTAGDRPLIALLNSQAREAVQEVVEKLSTSAAKGGTPVFFPHGIDLVHVILSANIAGYAEASVDIEVGGAEPVTPTTSGPPKGQGGSSGIHPDPRI